MPIMNISLASLMSFFQVVLKAIYHEYHREFFEVPVMVLHFVLLRILTFSGFSYFPFNTSFLLIFPPSPSILNVIQILTSCASGIADSPIFTAPISFTIILLKEWSGNKNHYNVAFGFSLWSIIFLPYVWRIFK